MCISRMLGCSCSLVAEPAERWAWPLPALDTSSGNPHTGRPPVGPSGLGLGCFVGLVFVGRK